MNNAAAGANNSLINSMSPAIVQKMLAQGGGSQGFSGGAPTGGRALQPQSQPSTQQLRMLVQQIQMAVQAGYLNHQVGNVVYFVRLFGLKWTRTIVPPSPLHIFYMQLRNRLPWCNKLFWKRLLEHHRISQCVLKYNFWVYTHKFNIDDYFNLYLKSDW